MKKLRGFLAAALLIALPFTALAEGGPKIGASERSYADKGISVSVRDEDGIRYVRLYVKRGGELKLVSSSKPKGKKRIRFTFHDLSAGMYTIEAEDMLGNSSTKSGLRVSESDKCPNADKHRCDRKCKTCSGTAEHKWENGKCSVCGALCPDAKTHSCTGPCATCGCVAPHRYKLIGETGVCDYRGVDETAHEVIPFYESACSYPGCAEGSVYGPLEGANYLEPHDWGDGASCVNCGQAFDGIRLVSLAPEADEDENHGYLVLPEKAEVGERALIFPKPAEGYRTAEVYLVGGAYGASLGGDEGLFILTVPEAMPSSAAIKIGVRFEAGEPDKDGWRQDESGWAYWKDGVRVTEWIG